MDTKYTLYNEINLDAFKKIDKESVDLIYLDPPFFTQRDWGEYDDRWSNKDEYLYYMGRVLWLCERVLKKTGSIYLHCDDTIGHRLRVLLDVVFGEQNYKNEIIWRRQGTHNNSNRYGRITDRILFYVKSKDYYFDKKSASSKMSAIEMNTKYKYEDRNGRYRICRLDGRGLGEGYKYEYGAVIDNWRLPEYSMLDLEKQGLIHWTVDKFGKRKRPYKKMYLKEGSDRKALQDLWTDIVIDDTDYPTQKPLKLLERIVSISSKKGDTVLDPFCGSGTTGVAAVSMGRNFIGIDKNITAISLTRKRIEDLHPRLI